MFAQIIRGWNAMTTYRKIRRVISIALILFGLWALTPYLYNRRVDEAFPAAAIAKPTQVATGLLSSTQAPAQPAMVAAEPTAAPARAPSARPTAEQPAMVAAEPTAAPVASGPVALLKGSFVAGSTPGDRATGTAALYALEDGKQLLRLQDFATTNGPDLFVVLSASANPDQDGLKNAAYLELAALKGNQGNQNYELPAGVDLGEYKSAVIWCRAFNIVFGYAMLEPAT